VGPDRTGIDLFKQYFVKILSASPIGPLFFLHQYIISTETFISNLNKYKKHHVTENKSTSVFGNPVTTPKIGVAANLLNPGNGRYLFVIRTPPVFSMFLFGYARIDI
jgi:hypothetical protein